MFSSVQQSRVSRYYCLISSSSLHPSAPTDLLTYLQTQRYIYCMTITYYLSLVHKRLPKMQSLLWARDTYDEPFTRPPLVHLQQ